MDRGPITQGGRFHGVIVDSDTIIQAVDHAEFEDCEFTRLTMNEWKPVGTSFIDCRFTGCALPLSAWADCSLQGVRFETCKLTGAEFSVASWTAFSSASPLAFVECDLSYVNFTGAKLGSATFEKCNMSDVEFAEADLSGAVFTESDLSGANFVRSNLSRCDFRAAYNFSIDPAVCKLRAAKFSRFNLVGLLSHLGIDIED